MGLGDGDLGGMCTSHWAAGGAQQWGHATNLLYGFRGISHRYVLETHSHDEVAGPVAEAGDGDGGRTRALAEEFGYDKPGDGPGSDFKEDDEEEDRDHADIAHPGKLALQEGAPLSVTIPTGLINYH